MLILATSRLLDGLSETGNLRKQRSRVVSHYVNGTESAEGLSSALHIFSKIISLVGWVVPKLVIGWEYCTASTPFYKQGLRKGVFPEDANSVSSFTEDPVGWSDL